MPQPSEEQANAALERMRRVLAAACAASGVANGEAPALDPRKRTFAMGDTRIAVALETVRGTLTWRVRHYYEVVDYADPQVTEVGEVIGTFDVGDVSLAAHAAVMRAVEYVVLNAIEGVQ